MWELNNIKLNLIIVLIIFYLYIYFFKPNKKIELQFFFEYEKAKCLLEKCTIDICTEEYTSKTCGQCGTIKNIGNKDIYCCNKCNLIIDRDVNGARNIAIKRLKETL